MADYYQKKNCKVQLSDILRKFGWEIYGYKPDDSEPQFDHYDPASWVGIATKKGFVFLIGMDRKNAEYYSGSKKQSLYYDDRSERTWPTFHGNPGRSAWHLEKDGQIIDRGSIWNEWINCDTSKHKEHCLIHLAAHLDELINGDQRMVGLRKLITRKELQPFTITEPKEIQVGQLIRAKETHFAYSIGYFFITRITPTHCILTKALKSLTKPKKDNDGNSVNLRKTSFETLLNEGKIELVELREVEIQEEKDILMRVRGE